MAIVRWSTGEGVILRLLESGELQRVQYAPDMATSLLAGARAHPASAAEIGQLDREGAYQLCYDASRKAVAALLQIQGLRATSKGGHVAITEAARAQFGGSSVGSVFRHLDRMRRRRNQIEYPSVASDHLTESELAQAVAQAREVVNVAGRLLEQLDPF
jgi:hypothetical protein